MRAVRAYCLRTGYPEPEVFHMNEGHAGFLGLERLREYSRPQDSTSTRRSKPPGPQPVFTTHTPVPAGIDRFPAELVERHFSRPVTLPWLPVDRVMALGAETYPGGDPNVFNMAVMGMRLAQRVNGVTPCTARSAGDVRWTVAGIRRRRSAHHLHHQRRARSDLGGRSSVGRAQAMGSAWKSSKPPQAGAAAERDAEELWRMRRALRERLITRPANGCVRPGGSGGPDAELAWIDEALDPEVLTVGFARRVPSYKRLTLCCATGTLHALLRHPERPIQIIIAGKAHPADEGGKRLIQEIVRFATIPGRAPHRLPARLRHGARRAPVQGATCG